MIITVKSDEICRDEQIINALKNTYMDIRPFMSIDAWKDEICRLLEKAEPKKPIGDLESCPRYRCPTCTGDVKFYIDSPAFPFCQHCGQAIDWSEVE